MNRETMQARIDSIEWFHELDFGNGLRSKSREPDVDYHLARLGFIERAIDDLDFAGKSVLDVGCWDGRWSFYAERRGARSVLACDDITQNWGSGEGIWLAKELLGSGIEINQSLPVYELTAIDKKFDIIFFMGVYYHLLDPILAFAQLRHCCHPDSVVIVEGEISHYLPTKLAYLNLPDPHGSIFIPSTGILRDMLHAAYFQVRTEKYLSGRSRAGWFAKAVHFAGAYAPSIGRKVLVRPAADRIVMICGPFTGQNLIHLYRPPFGLGQYDTRFSGEFGGATSG